MTTRRTSVTLSGLAAMSPEEAQAYDQEYPVSQPDAELQAIATRGSDAVVPMADIIRTAIESKTPAAELERLFALAERMADRAATGALNGALAAFRRSCPSIRKTSTAKIATNSGSGYSYTFADLAEIARTVDPLLAQLGLSYSWDSVMEGDKLTCTCTVRHADGATLHASFTAPTESRAGMSAQQKNASALTYARRQSLVQALGLTTCDPDDDGREHDRAAATAVTADQVVLLEGYLSETMDPAAVRAGMLKWAGVQRIEDFPAGKFDEAVTRLKAKRKGAA